MIALVFAPMFNRLRWQAQAAPWTVALLGAAAGIAIGLIVAASHGGLAAYRGSDLWAIVPGGWKDENLVTPYGSAAVGWFDLNDPSDSITVRATLPAGGSPEARAFARARALGKATRSWVYEIQWPGGRTAWEVLYTDHNVHTALFEFDACSQPIAMTVTLDASSSGKLAGEENTLPQGAEPVCDSAAFSSPDRADIAVPLHLPS